MRPTPRQKLADISPIFNADKVALHVSRENDRKLTPDGDDTKVVQPDGCGQARRGGGRVDYPPGRGADDPLKKLGPPSGPPGFFQL